VQKTFILRPKIPFEEHDYTSPYPVHKLDQAEVAKVAEEIGVNRNRLQVEHIGEGDSAAISSLFELDLETGQLSSLKLCGGLGGIFITKDENIYLSNSVIAAYYGDTGIKETDTLGIFGKRPYFRLDFKKSTLTRIPDDFRPDSNEIIQPQVVNGAKDLTTLAQVGIVKLISFKGCYYLQH